MYEIKPQPATPILVAKLVWRTCKCSCGRKWRTLPSSPNEYYSNEECISKTARERMRAGIEFVKRKTK